LSEKLPEDLKFIRGAGRYVDDVKFDNMLRLNVVRSPYAHARIKEIDLSDVTKNGASLVMTASDISQVFKNSIPSFPHPQAKIIGLPVLAERKANFVGQPVAAFVSSNKYDGEDLEELASVDYESLQPVLDPLKAIEPSSPIIHESIGTNVNLSTTEGRGDVDSAFSRSDAVVIEDRLSTHRVAPNPIEPRGIIASWDGKRFTVLVSCQGVFALREAFKDTLKLSNEQIRIIQTDVGGAFGSKSQLFPEYALACYAAMKLRRPVKWIETRKENLIATHHGRDVMADISLAAKRDGEILGLRGRVVADVGAYSFSVNTRYGTFVADQLTGPYRTPLARVEVLNVFTNKTPLGPYRGAGRPEAAFFYERMMDLLADELKLDEVEVRQRNFVRPEEMPYASPTGFVLDTEDYRSIVKKSLDFLEYRKISEQISKTGVSGASSAPLLLGLGISDYIEVNRSAPGESALARLEKDGTITLISGLGPHGQGHLTMLTNLISKELGVSAEEAGKMIHVVFGDSDLLARGVGTFGSRSTVAGGNAAVRAVQELKKNILEEASKISGIPSERLHCANGGVQEETVNGGSYKTVLTLRQVAEKTEQQIESSGFYEVKDTTSFGVHMAIVEVDPQTGRARIVKYGAVDDAGRIVDKMSAEAQVAGGIMQGIGEVFYEEMIYDSEGQPIVGTIGDAGVPTAVEGMIPRSELLEYPSSNPLGTRGVGEAGAIAAPDTLVRAVEKALRRSGRNVRIKSTLLKPEIVLELLSSRK